MLASSSRNVLKRAQRKACQVPGEMAVSAAFVLQAQRRHASSAQDVPEGRPSRSIGMRRTVDPRLSPEKDFHGPTHTPIARLNMQMATQLDRRMNINALTIAKRMKVDGVTPNRATYNQILRACAQEHLYFEGRAVLQDMISMGMQPDRQSFHHLLSSLSPVEQKYLFDVLKMMDEWSIAPNEITYELIITRFAENGRLELALQFLSQLGQAGLSPTLSTAASVIACAAELGHPRLALDLADAFEETSVRRLDGHVWVDILASCAQDLYASGTQRTWQKVVHEHHILPDEGCCLLVLHTAARHGLSSLALEVMETLNSINIVWGEHHLAPVVEAMCHHGEIKEAFMMLDYMRKNGISPTLQTASPILKLISVDTDAVDNAWGMLEIIREKGDAVDILAFNVVIQAAVALKDLQRAVGTYKAASQIGVKPDIDTYNLLLDACVGTRHRQLGDRLLSDMKEAGIKPDVVTYSRMVQLCLTQSTYEDAFFYLEEMKTLNIIPPMDVYEAIIRKLVSVGDTRWKIALDELKECGYQPSFRLLSFISSGGEHNGPEKGERAADSVVL